MKGLTIKEALELGVKAQNRGDLNAAEEVYNTVLKEFPENGDALHLSGLIEYQRGNFEAAIEKIKKALKIKRDSAIYHHNLGMCYDALGNKDLGEKSFLKALELDNGYGKAYLAYYNLGVYFKEKGDFVKALEHYDESIKLNADFKEAYWNRSSILLLLGRFKEGWEEYEYRFLKESPIDSRVFDKPKWDGSDLKGKRILVLSEQGLGDTIQFVRYLKLVKQREGRIIFECRKELRRLFSCIKEIDEFVDKREVRRVNYDYYIHLMSLPGIFKTNLGNIPEGIYLKADGKISKSFEKDFVDDKFKAGIVWAGNPEQEDDKNRSSSFDKFKCLSNVEGVQLYSLQKGKAVEELNAENIIDLDDKIEDFADTAGIVDNLDLVISVDTSVAHLVGALGKPVWTLLSFIPDWRYLLDRGDCAWYPSMKLFRQKKLGDWSSLFVEVADEFRRVVEEKRLK